MDRRGDGQAVAWRALHHRGATVCVASGIARCVETRASVRELDVCEVRKAAGCEASKKKLLPEAASRSFGERSTSTLDTARQASRALRTADDITLL
jgi:hypothetical protein